MGEINRKVRYSLSKIQGLLKCRLRVAQKLCACAINKRKESAFNCLQDVGLMACHANHPLLLSGRPILIKRHIHEPIHETGLMSIGANFCFWLWVYRVVGSPQVGSRTKPLLRGPSPPQEWLMGHGTKLNPQ